MREKPKSTLCLGNNTAFDYDPSASAQTRRSSQARRERRRRAIQESNSGEQSRKVIQEGNEVSNAGEQSGRVIQERNTREQSRSAATTSGAGVAELGAGWIRREEVGNF